MNDLVTSKNGESLTTSKVVFEKFAVSGGHRYIMKKISELIEEEPEFGAQNFLLSSYISPQNKVLKCFEMTRSGFSMIAMSLTGKKARAWQIKFIEAFDKMEEGMSKLDSRMNSLSIEGKNLDELGKAWGAAGQQIKKEKKSHTKKVDALISEVQLNLGFTCDNEKTAAKKGLKNV